MSDDRVVHKFFVLSKKKKKTLVFCNVMCQFLNTIVGHLKS